MKKVLTFSHTFSLADAESRSLTGVSHRLLSTTLRLYCIHGLAWSGYILSATTFFLLL